MTPRFATLVEMLDHRAFEDDGTGFVFLEDGEREGEPLSFTALRAKAVAIAAELQRRGLAGERVLLMYPPGLDFIAAFFGCIYARAIAVPVYPPDPGRIDRTLPRLEAIAADSDARALLTTDAVRAIAEHFVALSPRLARLDLVASDTVDPHRAMDWERYSIDDATIAFLQYTSGSTSLPKGVIVSHGNLLHNEAQIEAAFRRDRTTVSVNWLPMFHDMGLIGTVLQPIYNGAQTYLFSPLDFIAKPLRWLQAVSRYRAHTSGGPNFAYDLCVRKVREGECAGLDLSCWEIAFSGAEPVRADTIERFANRFAERGFRRGAFYPCYGLAEATLIVSGRTSREPPRLLSLDADALARGVAVETADATSRTLVSCGHPWLGQSIVIAKNGTRCPDGAVGEVLVRGASVSSGYFRRERETHETFGARVDGDGPFLRTGDLGFVRDGELYVTGRVKDVIIVAGRNHYPQDIEATLERADERVRRGCTAVFAIESHGTELLAAVVEVDERPGPIDVDSFASSLRAAVAENHGLRLHAVSLVRAGTIPKTTSGKIQRGACRGGFGNGTLDEIARWQPARTERPSSREFAAVRSAAHARIISRLLDAIRAVVRDTPVDLAADEPLSLLGLDSLQVVEVKAEAEERLDRTIPITWLREARTLKELAARIEGDDAATENKRVRDRADPWSTYVNPFVARQLEAFRLDKRFVRGSGCHVEDDTGRRYLDFTAAYGALPFGFNPTEIWDAIRDAAHDAPATLVQPSFLDAAGRLAERLVSIAPRGLNRVTFANSGAEAIEAAIKLVRAATGRLGIVSAHASFHGKTLGALSATGRATHQRAFGAPVAGFSYVPFGDLAALEQVLERDAKTIAAVLLEPIQGEGGIRVAPPGYLRGVRALCDRYGVLLVLDEVQTGLGRTGALFACEHEGVVPDVMALAKALGGGLVPIGAVLSREAVFTEEFALRHSSTFAGNALASLVGLRSLELLTRDGRALVRHVADVGAALHEGLVALQRRYPGLVRDVRGRGFMLGVEITDDHGAFARQGILASMAEQSTLGYLICSYLLDVEGIRLAPTLLGSRVLRIEPPLVATRAHCEEVLAALDRCFALLAACDSEALVRHLVAQPAPTSANVRRHGECDGVPARPVSRDVARPRNDHTEGRWGFVFHPLDHHSYVDFDAGLAGLDDHALRSLMTRLRGAPLRDTSATLLIGSTRIESNAGPSAYGEIFALPYTAEELHTMPSADAVALVREAVIHARDRGARIVGLGAYSSIVTKNGAWLGDVGVPITTGNGLTVVAAVDIILRAANAMRLPLATSTVAIVGATGSIGRALAIELAPHVGRLVLVGNPAHPAQAIQRLARVAEDVAAHVASNPQSDRGHFAAALARLGAVTPREAAARLVENGVVRLCIEPGADLTDAAIVATATSSPHALLAARQLGRGTIVCDVSRPANVSPALVRERPDLLVVDGGSISLPNRRDLGVSFGLAPGMLYACMAETALLALDRRYRNGSLGDDLPHDLIAELRALAARHEFRVAPARDGRPIDLEAWAGANESHAVSR